MSRPWSFSALVRTLRLAQLNARKPGRAGARPSKSARAPGTRPLLEQLEDRLAPAVSWTGGAGTLNWDDAANWSRGAVPGLADDVLIDVPVGGPITIAAANAVHSLTDTTASLAIAGGSLSLAAASSVSQDVALSGGTLTASGSLSVGGALTESDGVLTGGGTVTVSGLLTWTGGTMSGPGTTAADGGLQLGQGDPAGSQQLAGRTLSNAGHGVWSGPDLLTQESGTTFVNRPGATLDVSGGAGWDDAVPVPGTFDNQGTLTVADGSGSTLVNAFLVNSGSIVVGSGTLQLGEAGGGSVTGSLSADAGATLLLGANENYEGFDFYSGSSVGGAGTVDFGAGVAANFASGATYDVTGTSAIDTGGNSGANVVFAPGSTVQAVGALTIDSGVVNFSTGATVTAASLNLTSGGDVGTLTGSDTLDVSGLTTWIDGTMTGSGATLAEGGLNLGLTDGVYHVAQLDSRTFINRGTANWVGSGEIDLFAGSTFLNQSGATFNEQTNDVIWSDIGTEEAPSGLFDNQGTFVVEGGGTATMESRFDNEGQVEIGSGTWILSGNGASSGTFTLDSSTALQLNVFYGIPYNVDANGDFVSSPQILGGNASNVTLIDGSQASPQPVTGGDVVIPTTTQSFFQADGNVTVSSLDMTAGWLTVTGTLTVTGPMTWTGGDIAGPGTVVAEGGVQLGGANEGEVLYGATLINAGTLTLSDQNFFTQQYGATVENLSSGTFDLQGDDVSGGAAWSGDGTGTFYNAGTFEKTAGTGTATLDGVSLVNTGQVAVSSGTLDLEGGGIETGSFTAAAETTLEFGHSWWAFDSGAGVSGAGAVAFNFSYWSANFASGSTYNVSGATQVQSGEPVNFLSGSDVESLGAVTLGSGTLQFSTGSPVSAASLTESAGVLTGSDTLDVSGQTTWTGGTMSGPGTTVAEGGLALGLAADGNDQEVLDVRTLSNAGAAVWAGGGNLTQSNGSTFVNEAGATVNIENDLEWSSDGSGTIANAGTLLKSAGSGTTTLDAALNNTGSVQAQVATLRLQGGGTVGGSYLVLAGATLAFGTDDVTTSSVALPSDFTAGPIDWAGVFAGTAQDNSGSGLASVGVSLFDGHHYWDGTAFEGPSPVFNTAALTGTMWTYTILAGNFTNDAAYAAGTAATDNDGGDEPSAIASFLLAPTAPAVKVVTPAAGPTASGASVTIGGLGLANASAVDFGPGNAATIVSDTNTTIVVTSPAGTAGPVDVTVTTPFGTSPTSAADQFTYTPPPIVTSVTPAQGPIVGGTSVTITGTNLGTASTAVVDFGVGNPATIVSDNGSTLVVTDPAEAAGLVDVTVTTVGGTSTTSAADQFTYKVPQPPSFTTPSGILFTVGQNGSFTIATTGFPAATLSESGALPSGVTFTDNPNGTATLGGKPAAGSGVSFRFKITAANSVSTTAPQTFTLTVDQPPLITSANGATFTVGKAGRFTVTTAAGFPAATTLKESGALPGGVTFLDKGNGTATLSGSPAASKGGTYNFTIIASNAPSSQTPQAFTLTVNQAPAITSAKRTTFTVGQAGTFTITTTGFPAATLSDSGPLPAGVTFTDNHNGTATLSGIPQAGTGNTYSVTLTAANAVTSVTQTYTLTVDQPPIITSLETTTFLTTQSNTFTITTSGFPVATLTESGALPPGVTFVNKGNGTAVLSGKPTTHGTFTFTIDAGDSVLPDAVQFFELIVSS